MLSPLPRRSDWAYCFARFTQPYQPSPIWQSGRPAHCPFRGLLGVHSRYGLHTRAVTVFRDTLSEGFSHFVTSIAAPVASGWSGCRVGFRTHWKAPPFHGARQERTFEKKTATCQVQKSRATISRAACPWNPPPTARRQGGTGQSSIRSRSERRNRYCESWQSAPAHWTRSALGRSCRCSTEAR